MMMRKIIRMKKLHMTELAAQCDQKKKNRRPRRRPGLADRPPVTRIQPLMRELMKNSCSPVMPSDHEHGVERFKPSAPVGQLRAVAARMASHVVGRCRKAG